MSFVTSRCGLFLKAASTTESEIFREGGFRQYILEYKHLAMYSKYINSVYIYKHLPSDCDDRLC